jgi:mono/diheme cytochrome c family protein
MFSPYLLFSLFFFMGAGQQPAPAPALVIPPEAAQMTNPVKPSAEGKAHATKMYGYDCEMCHGANGDGKGELAVQQKLPMKDWTKPGTLQTRTDGELFYIIKNGDGGAMPAEGDRAKTADLWNMVLLVRSFSK